jgi:hypothetical protein
VDIYILDKSTIRIHSKHANFVVDPGKQGNKVSCDAVILLNNLTSDLSRVMDYRIILNGPGEYEVNGVKILGVKGDKGFVYSFMVDGFSAILGTSSEISKIKENVFLCQIVILNVDDEINSAVVTKLEPKIVILYGDNKESAAKILGKENLLPIKKFSALKDKLPEEMEVVVLG